MGSRIEVFQWWAIWGRSTLGIETLSFLPRNLQARGASAVAISTCPGGICCVARPKSPRASQDPNPRRPISRLLVRIFHDFQNAFPALAGLDWPVRGALSPIGLARPRPLASLRVKRAWRVVHVFREFYRPQVGYYHTLVHFP